MRVTAAISRRIEEQIAALAPEPVGHINFEGLKYQALALFGTILDCRDCGGPGRLGPDNALFCIECSALGWRAVEASAHHE
jgi:hypothetical protein